MTKLGMLIVMYPWAVDQFWGR